MFSVSPSAKPLNSAAIKAILSDEGLSAGR
jgi:hypothetical protein